MSDTQEPTAEQKKENIIKALGIAGFTENPEYPGMYSQINGNIKTVVDLTARTSTYLYDIAKKKKIVGAGDDGALKEVVELITKAEDGIMPTTDDYPYCPYCYKEHPDYLNLDEGIHTVQCKECDMDFTIEVKIQKWYHTIKI